VTLFLAPDTGGAVLSAWPAAVEASSVQGKVFEMRMRERMKDGKTRDSNTTLEELGQKSRVSGWRCTSGRLLIHVLTVPRVEREQS